MQLYSYNGILCPSLDVTAFRTFTSLDCGASVMAVCCLILFNAALMASGFYAFYASTCCPLGVT